VQRLRGAVPIILLIAVLALPTWFQLLPTPAHFSDQFTTNPGDPVLLMWSLKTQSHSLLSNPTQLMQGNIFFPHSDVLAYSDNLLLYVPIFGPALAVSGDNPIFAYNVVALVGYVGSAVAVYALALHLLGRRLPAATAAFLFSLSPYRSAAIGHIELVAFAFVALALLFLMRFLEGRRWRDAVLCGVSVGLCALGNLYLAVMLVTILPVFLAVWLVQHRRNLGARIWQGAALAAVCAAIVVSPTIPAYLRVQRSGIIERSTSEVVTARPSSFTQLPPSPIYSAIAHATDALQDALAMYPGAVLMLLVVVAAGLVLLDQRRRVAAGDAATADDIHAQRRRDYALPIAVAALVCLAVMAGPNRGILLSEPDRVMRRLIPGMGNLRDLTRFWILPLLVLCLIAGLALVHLGQRLGPRAGAAIAAGALVLAGFELVYRPPITAVFLDSPATASNEALRSLPGGPVMEFPLPPPDTIEFALVVAPRQLRSLIDGNPRVEGYTGEIPTDVKNVIQVARTFPAPAAIDGMRRDGVRYIVLHGGSTACSAFYAPDEMAALRSSLTAAVGVERLITAGADVIIELTPAPVDRSSITPVAGVAGRSAPLCGFG
jgi:hypothetical protein